MEHSKRIDIVKLKMIKEGSILYKNRQIKSPSDAAEIIKVFIADSDREQLVLIAVDTKNQPTAINIFSIGTLDTALVHPREIFKMAILANASSIIIGHNHPSGIADPSIDDLEITKRVKEAGDIMGINLLDHIIIGDENFVSLKDLQLI